MMTPEHRLATVLVGSAVVSLPAVSAMLSGEVEPGAVGIRFMLAVALVWVAIRLVEHMVGGYGSRPEDATAGTDQEGVEPPARDRRRPGDDARSAASHDDLTAARGDEDDSG